MKRNDVPKIRKYVLFFLISDSKTEVHQFFMSSPYKNKSSIMGTLVSEDGSKGRTGYQCPKEFALLGSLTPVVKSGCADTQPETCETGTGLKAAQRPL